MPDDELNIGDRLELKHGPFVSTWRVAEIIDAGAVLEYVGDVHFVGYDELQHAPNETKLTEHPDQAFLGRAHFAEYIAKGRV